jgi:hypothetical protein
MCLLLQVVYLESWLFVAECELITFRMDSNGTCSLETDDIDFAGDFVQSLAVYLNLNELQVFFFLVILSLFKEPSLGICASSCVYRFACVGLLAVAYRYTPISRTRTPRWRSC